MTPAADSFAEIWQNVERIRAESVQRCPIVEARTLADCLRSPTECNPNCPHRGDWIGPEENPA